MDVKSLLASKLGELGEVVKLCTVSYSLVNGRVEIHYVKVPVRRLRKALGTQYVDDIVFELADRLGFKYVISKFARGGRKYYLVKDLRTYELLANRNVRIKKVLIKRGA